MIKELLKLLAVDIDSVVIVGAPNIRFVTRIDLDKDNVVIAYRKDIDECKILLPLNVREKLNKLISKECGIVYYSYDVIEKEGYVIGRSFDEILIGFLKSFIKPRTMLGIPFKYIDLLLASLLHKYWNLKDITKQIASIKMIKNHEDLTTITTIFKLFSDILKKLRETKNSDLIAEYVKHVIKIVDAVYVEPLVISSDVISLHTYLKKNIHRFSFNTSIPLNEDVEKMVNDVDNSIRKIIEIIHIGTKCSDFYRAMKINLEKFSKLSLDIDICGVGTEVCEYPSLSNFLYDDTCVLQNGMAIKIEIKLKRTIYVAKFIAIRENKIEVF